MDCIKCGVEFGTVQDSISCHDGPACVKCAVLALKEYSPLFRDTVIWVNVYDNRHTTYDSRTTADCNRYGRLGEAERIVITREVT